MQSYFFSEHRTTILRNLYLILYWFVHLLHAGSCTLHIVFLVSSVVAALTVASVAMVLLPSGSLCVLKVLNFSIPQRVLSDPNGELKVQVLELDCKKELNLSTSKIYMYWRCFFKLVPIRWNIQIMFSELFSFGGSKLCFVFLCYCALERLAFHKLFLYVFLDFSSFVLESLYKFFENMYAELTV